MIFGHLQQHGCTWRVYYVKQNTSDRERYTLYDITYIWNLKNQKTSEYNKLTHRYREQTNSYQCGEQDKPSGVRGTKYWV